MKQFIYADNAATTKLDNEAFEAMAPYLLNEYGNASQPYSFARKPKKALAEARQIIASSINALPEEIFFTSGGTESDNWAIKGSAFIDAEERATITTSIEHHAVLRACEAIERLGYPVAYLNPDSKGIIDRFGPNVETYACDQQNFRVIAEIAVGKIFFNWIFGFDGKVKIKAPEDVKQQYKEQVLRAMEIIDK